MISCLRLPAFRRLLLAYVLNELAWSVGTLALAVLVFRRTGSALGSTGFFFCAQFLPALLSPPLVARLDRAAPGKVLPRGSRSPATRRRSGGARPRAI